MIKIGKNISSFSTYSCKPKTRDELKEIIRLRISKEGYNCDLNDIDTSLITDMSSLFLYSSFKGNISNWDTSNVRKMKWMFYKSSFNNDISNWDVSKVTDMSEMFYWSNFNKPIGDWNVSNVKTMWGMFHESSFDKDISKWNISEDCDTSHMLLGCPIREEFKPEFDKS